MANLNNLSPSILSCSIIKPCIFATPKILIASISLSPISSNQLIASFLDRIVLSPLIIELPSIILDLISPFSTSSINKLSPLTISCFMPNPSNNRNPNFLFALLTPLFESSTSIFPLHPNFYQLFDLQSIYLPKITLHSHFLAQLLF